MASVYTDKSEYAVSSWTYETCELQKALKDIAEHGFNTVELWADTVHFDPRAGLDRKQVKQWLRDYNLKVHSSHSPFRNFKGFTHDENFRQYRMKLLKNCINDCADFSIPILVVHGLDRNEYNYTCEKIQIMKDDLAELCNYGRKQGVMIALENMVNSSEPGEVRCRLEDHVQNFSGFGLKYCLDIGHAVLNGADLFREIDVAGEDLVTFHIHNNDGHRDSHALPDDGVIDWPTLHEYIRGKGYNGQFVLEIYGGLDAYSVMKKINSLFS